MFNWFNYMYYWFEYQWIRFQVLDFDTKLTIGVIVIGSIFTLNLIFFLYRTVTNPESFNSNDRYLNSHSDHLGTHHGYYNRDHNYFNENYSSSSSSHSSSLCDLDDDSYMNDSFSSSHQTSGPIGLFGGDYNQESTLAASGIKPYSDAYGYSSMDNDSFSSFDSNSSSFSSDSFSSSSFDSGSSFDNNI